VTLSIGDIKMGKTVLKKLNKYTDLKEKHTKIVNKFPQFFAFSNEQLEKGLKKLNVTKEEICSTGYGGFIRKIDKKAYGDMWLKISKETEEAQKDDLYLFQAFLYELANHEFCITCDYEDTLSSLGFEYEKMTKRELEILKKAKSEYLNNCEDYLKWLN